MTHTWTKWGLFLGLTAALAGCSEKNSAAGTADKESTQQTEAAETRTVEHLYGKAEVPADPEKVVVLSHVSWEGSLVSVDETPYAVMAYDNEFPPHLTEELKDVKALPYADEIDPEEILSLEPDLLIISDRYKPLYDQISETIPTVAVEVGGDWKEDHLKVAEAVGKKEEGQKVIDDLQAKATDIGTRIREKTGDETFMSVAINKQDIRVYGKTNHATSSLLYDDLGLKPTENIPEDFGENISIEGLAKYNPDHIIDVSYFNSGEFFDTVTQGDVWNNLTAVKNGNVHTLKTTWGFWDPIEREKGLDEIEQQLLGK